MAIALPAAVMLVLSACSLEVPEDHFACDLADPQSCPTGFACQLRDLSAGYRCYSTPGSFCGDGYLDPGEQCDGLDVGTEDCISQGFWTGPLACNATCEFDTTNCRVIESVAAGNTHVCALDGNGQAWCWGGNQERQLGQLSESISPEPLKVFGDHELRQVAAAEHFSCGLSPEGALWCWGGGNEAEPWGAPVMLPSLDPIDSLATGFSEHLYADTRIFGLSQGRVVECFDTVCNHHADHPTGGTFTHLSAMGPQICALDDGGAVWCWTTNESDIPAPVPGAHAFTALAAGRRHACALTAAGAIYCWGENELGQLGDGTTANRPEPTLVTGGHIFTALTAGTNHSCGIDQAGGAWCWGWQAREAAGQQFSSTPVAVPGGLTFTALSGGDRFTCGITPGGMPHCWGANHQGQSGTDVGNTSPRQVSTGQTFTALIAGDGFTCGLDAPGDLHCWGFDVGSWDPEKPMRRLFGPTPVFGGYNFASLAASPTSFEGDGGSLDGVVCGVDTSGTAWCWGDGTFGQLGNGTAQSSQVPVAVASATPFQAVALGLDHACGLDNVGHAWCWGMNTEGQLGNGSIDSSGDPSAVVAVTGNHVFTKIGTGSLWSCGLDPSGRIWCWGVDAFIAFGDENTINYPAPTPLSPPGKVFAALAVGPTMTCASEAGGGVACWGAVSSGEDAFTLGGAPASVAIPNPIRRLTVGRSHGCAIDTSDHLWCWGNNEFGQLGDGTEFSSGWLERDRTVFASPVSEDIAVGRVSAGWSHTCAVGLDAKVWCWGDSRYGQLGVNDQVSTPEPVPGPR